MQFIYAMVLRLCWHMKIGLSLDQLQQILTTIVVHSYKMPINDVKPVHSLIFMNYCILHRSILYFTQVYITQVYIVFYTGLYCILHRSILYFTQVYITQVYITQVYIDYYYEFLITNVKYTCYVKLIINLLWKCGCLAVSINLFTEKNN